MDSIVAVPEFFKGGVRLDVSRGKGHEWVSLTDLWKADGSDPAKKPVLWLRSEKAQGFLTELAKNLGFDQGADSHLALIDAVSRTTHGGLTGGTWAHRFAALAYGEWIRPSFHVRIVSEWDGYSTGRLSSPNQLTRDDVVSIVKAVTSELLLSQRSAAPAYGQPSIAPYQHATLQREKKSIVELGMKLQRWDTARKGGRVVQTAIGEATGGWGTETGSQLRNMPIALFPVAQKAIAKLRIDLERQDALVARAEAEACQTKQTELFPRPALVKLPIAVKP